MSDEGTIIRVTGPVVQASGMKGARMYEIVKVGTEELIGEIITLEHDIATIQVYEETAGIAPGEVVKRTQMPLSVELGPGLLGNIYDGIQRPLREINKLWADFIDRGATLPALSRDTKWDFQPTVTAGDTVSGGDTLGSVQESTAITHYIMVPPGISGDISEIAPAGSYTIEDTIAIIKSGQEGIPISMVQKWPVRSARPSREKLDPTDPLITGQRIIDTLFPIAKGGTAAIPGPFGSGKTVVQHQLAKWANADVIVFIGCGERGNEMADVLTEFPTLDDPRTGEPLIRRMVLIANTSNMPVAAREASVYTGITIAEYFRDMGYDVALMADSTSRWAEAMREISGRLEEMPGEEGYPAYLGSRLADFYERAGRVSVCGRSNKFGSISVIGAVSPPGGDFSEPVTQNTLRIVKVFWALDSDLAYMRHFPAINWLLSYSLYGEEIRAWWQDHAGPDWDIMRKEMMVILQKENELEEIVKLVGPDVLPEEDKLTLYKAEIIRESFLAQYAFHPHDTYSDPIRQYRMMTMLFRFFDLAKKALALDITTEKVRELPIKSRLARMGTIPRDSEESEFAEIENKMTEEFATLGV
ncbi:MAG TPA: V-type ATP synthase subunit A [Methanoregulaceae archaeon]|nr:V-type ATP synthase subunit A [Methanoregulaceae archaeon]